LFFFFLKKKKDILRILTGFNGKFYRMVEIKKN
jgi:hypothetical protein